MFANVLVLLVMLLLWLRLLPAVLQALSTGSHTVCTCLCIVTI
jgi:hypothetical protein